jgi:hypothetical protein
MTDWNEAGDYGESPRPENPGSPLECDTEFCDYCNDPILPGDERTVGADDTVFCCPDCLYEYEDATRAAEANDRELGLDHVDMAGWGDG